MKSIIDKRIIRRAAAKAAVLTCLFFTAVSAQAANPIALSQVPVPEPRNLSRFVIDKNMAIQMGKALYWDMQLGSDGVVSCATCHFHAGTDNRTRNTLHPGPNRVFEDGHTPNSVVAADHFPVIDFVDPENEASARFGSDDIITSQGVTLARLLSVAPGQERDRGQSIHHPSFFRNGRSVRQSVGRNTPTVINSVFNFTNFLDGRANNFFNGVNPFGVMDQQARVYINNTGTPEPISLVANLATNPFALDNASLASQAVGPPLSELEMSWVGRTWPDIGRKMLPMRPLAKQAVHPQDSHLASLRHPSGKGLATTYEAMIRAAFRPEFWNAAVPIDGFTQMEMNFSLFFGLAVQLYEATLVADQTPFDRWLQGDPNALSESADRGRAVFFSGGAGCANCHVGPELTAASVSAATAPGEAGLIELMAMGDNQLANYDIGFYNISVTRTTDDLGRGGTAPIKMADGRDMPLSFARQHFEGAANLGFIPIAQPGCVNGFLGNPPTICPPAIDTITRVAVNGAFKVPGLRNIELTGPYQHNGGMLTLKQVVHFYLRGGNFPAENIAHFDPFIRPLGQLQGNEPGQDDLINFLLSLTDERVRQESAPFDHPQLFVPVGHQERVAGNPKRTRELPDDLREVPAVGAGGRAAQGLPPLKPFLADDLTGEALTNFHHTF